MVVVVVLVAVVDATAISKQYADAELRGSIREEKEESGKKMRWEEETAEKQKLTTDEMSYYAALTLKDLDHFLSLLFLFFWIFDHYP